MTVRWYPATSCKGGLRGRDGWIGCIENDERSSTSAGAFVGYDLICLPGLTWLRKLADALSEYSDLRMREVPRGLDDAALVAMDAQIANLEAEIRRAEADQKAAEDRLTACDRERSELTRELGDYALVTTRDWNVASASWCR